jgi:hypothetical protein
VIVVHFGGGLVGERPQNAADVRHEAALDAIGAARKRVLRAGQSKPSPM